MIDDDDDGDDSETSIVKLTFAQVQEWSEKI